MTMFTCDACARPARFLDANLECPECAKGSPQERAAIALFDDFKHSIGWPSKTWDDPALDDTTGRETFRRKARLALTAAIDIDELTRMLPDLTTAVTRDTARHFAAVIGTHYLGTEGLPDDFKEGARWPRGFIVSVADGLSAANPASMRNPPRSSATPPGYETPTTTTNTRTPNESDSC